MPTLNDILTANGDYTPVSGYPVDDKYENDSPVINVYDRIIGEIVGDTSTSGENVSQYLTFRIPRHPDHYDLIENGTNIRILYRLEDDTGEDVVPVNVVANEDYIIFGWKIPLVVTVNPGVVTFIIHAYKSENNIITYHYKTLPKTYSILETMETDVVVPKIEMYNLAEAYTRGTITDVFGHTRPVEEGEPGYHDNSKYYKELAETAIGGKGDKGDKGDTGNGIQSVTKTSTSGLVDTYTILYTNGTTSTFAVTNGKDGTDGHTPTITASKTDKVTTVYADGVAIATINDGVDGQGAVTDVTVNGVTVMDGNVAKVIVPTKVSDLSNDSGFITGYTETDPTVPSWAKQPSKPTYTASEVGALPDSTQIPSKTSDLTNDSGFIESETDPVFIASAAHGISSSDISAWNAKQNALGTITVTLTVEGWSNNANNAQTVTATGVTASNTVIVSPVPSAMSDYVGGGIVCTAQGANALTFECDTTPTSAIDVNVVII